ncbi:hypothetical protein SGRIM128S_08107 [Streptomyces griseomycini]
MTFADIDVTNGMAERGERDVLEAVVRPVLPYVLDDYALDPLRREPVDQLVHERRPPAG